MVESRERKDKVSCTRLREFEGTGSMEEDKMKSWLRRKKVNKLSEYIGFGHTTDYRSSHDQPRCRDHGGE